MGVPKDAAGLDLQPFVGKVIGFNDKKISQCCCSFSGVYLLFVRTGAGKGFNGRNEESEIYRERDGPVGKG